VDSHGHGGDTALREPRGHGPQVLGEVPEAPDGLRVAVERDADVEAPVAPMSIPAACGVQTGVVTARVVRRWRLAWRLLRVGGEGHGRRRPGVRERQVLFQSGSPPAGRTHGWERHQCTCDAPWHHALNG